MMNPEAVFQSLSIIEAHIQEKLTPESLAGSVYLSKYHYQRIFREAVGDSVMRYITRRRLALAAQALANTDFSILEIALRYGYDSHEGFSRSFRRHMGVSPAEFRKHPGLMGLPILKKECCKMTYAKVNEEILCRLNQLIAEAKETAAQTKRQGAADPALTCYQPAWTFLADQSSKQADRLAHTLERIQSLLHQPEEISARFLLMDALQQSAEQFYLIAFHARLMTARALPQHRPELEALCVRYAALAENARLKVGEAADFFQELVTLIFQDMRETAEKKLQAAAQAGREAARPLLEQPQLPYGYIAQELSAIAEALAAAPLDQISAGFLDEQSLRLESVSFAAGMDLLRAPAHQNFFAGLPVFQERLAEAASFFRVLSDDLSSLPTGPSQADSFQREQIQRRAMLLFSLRGELQKLAPHLTPAQVQALEAVCRSLDQANRLPWPEAADQWKAQCQTLLDRAKGLELYGSALEMLAQELSALS